MKIRKFDHSCVLVEEGNTRLFVDPGRFSHGLDRLTDLAALLITHIHADHMDLDRVETLLEHNPGVQIVCAEDSAKPLSKRGVQASVVHDGGRLDLGMPVRIAGSWHAVIHPDIPIVENIGYVIDERLFIRATRSRTPARRWRRWQFLPAPRDEDLGRDRLATATQSSSSGTRARVRDRKPQECVQDAGRSWTRRDATRRSRRGVR